MDLFIASDINLDIRKQIIQLTTDLNRYNLHYHTYDQPLVSDEEYDRLFRQLQEMEQAHPDLVQPDTPTQKVGGQILDEFRQIAHELPMLSLSNIFSSINEMDQSIRHAELFQFTARIDKELGIDNLEFVAMPKYDGVAVSLVYKNGILTSAVTRGDGYIGEDVTANVKTIRNIPLRLDAGLLNNTIPDLIEVRGEILILNKDFVQLNQAQQIQGKKIYANPRNLAAGSIRQLDSKVTASRPLRFYAYALARYSGEQQFLNFWDELICLREYGFLVDVNCTKLYGVDALISYYEDMLIKRGQLEFGIDGIVYKLNDIAMQKKLGFVARAPRFAIAHKFPAEEVESELLNIEVQVGRTGALTPVARIAPVLVGGVVVTNTTLHNQEEIWRKDIRIGDRIIVRRAGDVIPEIVRSRPDLRNRELLPFKMPETCPVCNSHLIQDESEATIRCSAGLYCIAQKKQAITHFASKLALNIDGLGEKIVEQLVDSKLVNIVPDIYRLTVDQLMGLERFAIKSATNLIAAINQSKATTLPRLIYALGIRHVGEASAKDLAKAFGSLDKFMSASKEELLQVNDIGEVVAGSILNFFSEPHNLQIINQLIALGVNYPVLQACNLFDSEITAKTFVITGSFVNYKRDEIKEFLESYGAKVAGSVSKKTNYVIAGSDAGSKLDKAVELGILVIDELGLAQLMSRLETT